METQAAIKNRHSIRSYQDKPIPEKKLQAVVDAADSAPFAGPFHITVVLDKAVLQTLDSLTIQAMKNSVLQFLRDLAETPGFKPLFDAPAMLVFSVPESNPYGMANCSAAATAGALMATDLYLGSCFAVTPTLALNENPTICKQIGIPDGYKPLCTLMLGEMDDPNKNRHPRNLGNNVNYYR